MSEGVINSHSVVDGKASPRRACAPRAGAEVDTRLDPARKRALAALKPYRLFIALCLASAQAPRLLRLRYNLVAGRISERS
jgi:hypothetical protein